MDVFYRYKQLNIEGSLISLEDAKIESPYFCYPINAEVIGLEGCILYCFLPEYGDMVFACNPESCADSNVYPLAKNFEDFLRLILACGSANPVEQIVWMKKEQFEAHVQKEKELQSTDQKALLAYLEQEFQLTPMGDPFEYVKELQLNFDDSNIQFSDEYYDTLGIFDKEDCSIEQNLFEFEPVVFRFEKKE